MLQVSIWGEVVVLLRRVVVAARSSRVRLRRRGHQVLLIASRLILQGL
jgi:hypothetical protein